MLGDARPALMTPRPQVKLSFAAVPAALALLVAFVYRRVLFGGHTFVTSDALTFTLPSREFLSKSLCAGRLPEWADWIGLGMPFAANPIHGVTYLPLWIVCPLAPPLGSDLVVVLHVWIAAVGTAALAARLGASAWGQFLAGALLALCGYVATVVPNGLGLILSWVPWVAWAAHYLSASDEERGDWRPRALVFAALFAAEVMTGEPAHILMSVLMAVGITVVRSGPSVRALARLALAGLAAGALSAVVLLPGASLHAWSNRASGLSATYGSVWALHPLRLAELVWPEVLGARNVPFLDLGRLVASTAHGVVSSPSWSRSLFLGAPAFLLAGAAALRNRTGRRLLALSLVFLLLALGDRLFLYTAFRLLPLAGWARYPEKYILGAIVLWTALAGVGFSEVFERARSRPGAFALAAVAAAALMGILVLAVFAFRPSIASLLAAPVLASQFPYDVERALSVSLMGGLLAFLGLVVFAGATAAHGRLPRAAPVAAASIVAVAVWHTQSVTRTIPRALTKNVPAVLGPVENAIRAAPLRPRLVGLKGTELGPKQLYESPEGTAAVLQEHLFPNVGARFGLDPVPGFGGVMSGALEKVWSPGEQGLAMHLDRAGQVLGVDYALVPSRKAELFGLPLAARGELVSLVSLPKRPRAFIAPRWTWTSQEDALRRTSAALSGSGEFDPGHVFLSGQSEAVPPAGAESEPASECEPSSPRPEEVRLGCTSRLGGYAVLLDEVAPGWTATVDGREAPVERADGLFRAVAVGPGRHEIVFGYQTPGLRAGLGIGAAAWLAWVAALVWLRGSRTRRAPAGNSSKSS